MLYDHKCHKIAFSFWVCLQLFVQIYDSAENSQGVILQPSLDGYNYLYVTGTGLDGFFRQALVFKFKLNICNKHYNVEVIDNRGYIDGVGTYSAGNIIYPNVRFIRLVPKVITSTINGVIIAKATFMLTKKITL